VRIYCIRHAYAGETIVDDIAADNARVLMPEGIDTANALGAWMVANDEVPSLILHSPLSRAAQTAKLLARQTGAPKVEELNLGIDKPWEMVVKKLARDEDMRRVALIAHIDNIMPGLRALNFLSGADKYDVDPIAKGELRILKIDRDTAMWTEKQRVLPSDLGGVDYY
jgi:phosphohistidine phosphatase SixA